MYSKTILAMTGALVAAVSAAPMDMDKRDIVYETQTAQYYTTVGVTTTVWVDPTDTPVAPDSSSAAPPPPPPETTTTTTSTSSTPVAPPPAPTTTSTSTPVVAPYVPPTTTSTPAAAPPPSSSAAPAPSSSSPATGGGSPSGSTHTGDITYYDVGLGSCGTTNSDSDNVVAMAEGMMEKSYCGKTITISYQGATHTATVEDTCPGCSGASLDLSPSLFKAVAPNGDGRVHDVEWWFSE